MKNLWNFNLWVKLMENSEQWSPHSVQPCPLLENAVLCSWAHLVVLLSLPLRSSPQKILRLSDRQTSTSPAHQPSKGDSQRCRWLRPQPCLHFCGYPYIVFIWETLLPSRCCMCPSPRVKLHPCSTGKISVLTPYAAHPSRLRDPNQCVLITNGETTFNSHPSSWVDVRRLLPSLQWVKAIK